MLNHWPIFVIFREPTGRVFIGQRSIVYVDCPCKHVTAMRLQMPAYTSKEVLRLSVDANVDPRTALKWLAGLTCGFRVSARLETAARALGMLRRRTAREVLSEAKLDALRLHDVYFVIKNGFDVFFGMLGDDAEDRQRRRWMCSLLREAVQSGAGDEQRNAEPEV